uniref:Putative secreted protein n=1 Tax=Ixodes ricinus TaxID=34613 RepID=A0A6B0UKN5_IXORI
MRGLHRVPWSSSSIWLWPPTWWAKGESTAVRSSPLVPPLAPLLPPPPLWAMRPAPATMSPPWAPPPPPQRRSLRTVHRHFSTPYSALLRTLSAYTVYILTEAAPPSKRRLKHV